VIPNAYEHGRRERRPDEGGGGKMKRLALTQQTVRCPRDDRTACLTVLTDPGGRPSRRTST
jgi:hypothetical protein